MRVRTASATAALATRLMPKLGIKTVRDITRQDCLGLPVAVASRPCGVTNRLHWGKGLAMADARAGALMEALEFAVAERTSAAGADFHLQLGDLVDLLPNGLSVEDFAPRHGVDASSSRLVAAVWCENLIEGPPVLLPAELVLLPCPTEPGLASLYGWSSNGLASGNTLDEATLHALFEILEHDALAMDVDEEGPTVEALTLPTFVRDAADAWRSLGIHLAVRWLPSDFGVACFEAVIEEPAGSITSWSVGWGCHSDRDIALARAVCEAAQVRLVAIHMRGRSLPAGSAMTSRRTRGVTRAPMVRRMNPASRAVHYAQVQTRSVGSVRDTLQVLVGHLVAAGIPAIFRRSMDVDDEEDALHGFRVVKVVVPRCEPGMGRHSRTGPRLTHRLMEI